MIDTAKLTTIIGTLVSADNNVTKEQIQANINGLKAIKEKLSDEYEAYKNRIDTAIFILEKDLKRYEKEGNSSATD